MLVDGKEMQLIPHLITITGSFAERVKAATGLSLAEFKRTMDNKDKKSTLYLVKHHICNQACGHCFMVEKKEGAKELSLDELLEICERFKTQDYAVYPYAQEPLVYPDFFKLFAHYPQDDIETNASLIPDRPDFLDELRNFGTSRVVVSLHGDKNAHCALANVDAETYHKTILGLKLIKAAGFELEVRTNLYNDNKHTLPAVAALLDSIGVDRWGIMRTIPAGKAADWPFEKFIYGRQAEAMIASFLDIKKAYRQTKMKIYLETLWGPNFFLQSTLQFLAGKGGTFLKGKYWCPSIGENLYCISLDSSKVYPCAFLHTFEETAIGKVVDGTIVFSADHFWKKQNLEGKLRGMCAPDQCQYHEICLGGCRTLAYCFARRMHDSDPFTAGADFCITRFIEENPGLFTW